MLLIRPVYHQVAGLFFEKEEDNSLLNKMLCNKMKFNKVFL